MNILCLDQFGELGGAQRCLLDLLPALVERGWGVHAGAPGPGPLTEKAAALGAVPHAIACGPYSSGYKSAADMIRFAAETPRLATTIRKLAARHGVDLIYVNGPRLLPAIALAARRGPRVLFHSHSLLSGSALRLAGRSLAALRAEVVASSRFVGSPLRRYLRGREMRIVYNGVRRIEMPGRARTGGEFRAGVIGRISPEKGQAEFLRAARILNREKPQSRFVICGAPLFSDPAAVKYRAEVETLASGLPVEFTGWTENVEEVLGSLDLVVVPSTAVDATPRVILEAFSAGVPVVAFALGGIPEIVEDEVTGFLVKQRSPEALATVLGRLAGDPRRLEETAVQARARANEAFSLERYRTQLIEAIEAAVRI